MTVVKDPKSLLNSVLGRRDFRGLMELYEINYRLIQKLIPDLDTLPSLSASESDASPASPMLHLSIEERCRYTTTLSLTHYFEDERGDRFRDPDLRLRIYHDAGLVEAVSCRPEGFMALGVLEPQVSRRQLDCRWKSNLFLEKFLLYSLRLGHRFTAVARPCGEAVDEPAVVE